MSHPTTFKERYPLKLAGCIKIPLWRSGANSKAAYDSSRRISPPSQEVDGGVDDMDGLVVVT